MSKARKLNWYISWIKDGVEGVAQPRNSTRAQALKFIPEGAQVRGMSGAEPPAIDWRVGCPREGA